MRVKLPRLHVAMREEMMIDEVDEKLDTLAG